MSLNIDCNLLALWVDVLETVIVKIPSILANKRISPLKELSTAAGLISATSHLRRILVHAIQKKSVLVLFMPTYCRVTFKFELTSQ